MKDKKRSVRISEWGNKEAARSVCLLMVRSRAIERGKRHD